MSILLGVGIGVAALTAYVGRKSWLAFHRVIGVTPGKVTYIAPPTLQTQQESIPKLVSLNLDEELVTYLPNEIIMVLQRIDIKADKYQTWREQRQNAGRELPYGEDEFVVAKLLTEHLPEMLSIYTTIRANHMPAASLSEKQASTTQVEAYETLLELLEDLELRLDKLNEHCETQKLQDLKVMKRYLDTR